MAATKEKRFQWSKGDKIENLIRCLANFKAQMEYKNIDFNADKVKQYEAVREATARLYEEEPTFFGLPVEICSQRQVSLQFHHLVGCYHPKRLKIGRRQKAKL